MPSSTRQPPFSDPPPTWAAWVQREVAGRRYGTVQMVIHDGRIVQVERMERFRLPDPPLTTECF